MPGDAQAKGKLLRLCWNQNKRCTLCDPLTIRQTGWNIHARMPRCAGGSNKAA